MGHTGRARHRDRDPGRRVTDAVFRATTRAYRLSGAQREQIAKCLEYIDEARRALERQENRDNREIIRELRASAARIFAVISDLEEMDS